MTNNLEKLIHQQWILASISDGYSLHSLSPHRYRFTIITVISELRGINTVASCTEMHW